MTASEFVAERQPGGDVWITARNRKDWHDKVGTIVPSALQDGFIVIIPKDKCQKLAELLWPGERK